MLRCVVKNSFLTLEVAPDGGETARARGPRARSADSVLDDRPPKWERSEAAQAALERLNEVLIRSQWRIEEPEELEEQAPSVDELRQLQRKLGEVTGKMPLEKRRVLSSSSVSTMVSDCEEVAIRTPLPRPWSSGSVSTMVSEFWEDALEEGGAEFGPIFEEDTAAKLDEELAFFLQEDFGSLQADVQLSFWERGLGYQASQEASDGKDFIHGRVPRSLNLAEEFSRASHEGPPTTMMIRNIPNRCTQRDLVRELEGMGFGGSFDFLYVPMDKVTMCNVGYAFVNFVDHCWAERCMEAFDNYCFKKHRKARGKIATVSVAHIQGLQANVRHYQHAASNGIMRSKQRGPVIMASTSSTLQSEE